MGTLNKKKKESFYRNWLLNNGNFNCFYCSKPTLLHLESGFYQHNRATIDHVIPKCFGGKNKKSNLVLACEECNCNKSKIDKFYVHSMY